MKKITLLFMALCAAVSLQAQITLTAADFTFNQNGGDTIYYHGLQKTQVTLPQFGADMFWDYSNVPLDGDSYFSPYEAGTHPDFPTANLRRESEVSYLGQSFPSYRYFTYDATGFYYNGEVDLDLNFPLGSITGTPTDTLTVVGGGRVNSIPRTFVVFPFGYGYYDNHASYTSINFIVNVQNFGLSNFAVEQRRKRVVETEGNAWGTIALTNPQTQTVDTFETILMYQTSFSVDSFYDAANNPLPATLLTPLGFAQGATSSVSHNYAFLIPGLDYYGVYFFSVDGVIESALINQSIFTDGTPVSTKSIDFTPVTHEIYPNPIQNHQFQLEIEKNNGENWQLDIYNILGQSVHNELIINNISTIKLNNSLPSGQYFYAVRNENGETVANGKLMK